MIKLSNIRLVEGHAAYRADIAGEGFTGWIEDWFEEEYRYDEINGECDDKDLEEAYAKLREYFKQHINPHYLVFVQMMNAIHKDASIEFEEAGKTDEAEEGSMYHQLIESYYRQADEATHWFVEGDADKVVIAHRTNLECVLYETKRACFEEHVKPSIEEGFEPEDFNRFSDEELRFMALRYPELAKLIAKMLGQATVDMRNASPALNPRAGEDPERKEIQ